MTRRTWQSVSKHLQPSTRRASRPRSLDPLAILAALLVTCPLSAEPVCDPAPCEPGEYAVTPHLTVDSNPDRPLPAPTWSAHAESTHAPAAPIIVGPAVDFSNGFGLVVTDDAEARDAAKRFWDRLVERYRALETYQDEVDVYEVVRSPRGDTVFRTQIRCSWNRDRADVVTPASQVARVLRLPCPARIVDDRRLWTAPHLALHCSDDPLRCLRAPVCGTFEVTRLELPGPDASEPALLRLESQTAVVELAIDCERMLITGLWATHPLGDGRMETAHTIRPKVSEPWSTPGAAPARQRCLSANVALQHTRGERDLRPPGEQAQPPAALGVCPALADCSPGEREPSSAIRGTWLAPFQALPMFQTVQVH